jgi:hypothetical protein
MKKAVLQKVLVAVALAAFCMAAMAATTPDDKTPDLSGTWKLDVAKSDFGPIPPPDSQTNVIDHKEPKLKVKSTTKGGMQGDNETEASYTTDGAESTNKMGPMEVKSIAKWDGKKLVITSKLDMQGSPLTIKATYDLSDDGKVMTVTSDIDSAMGQFVLKSVFNKSE